MYSTCLFCTSHLGRNEVLERFPVGGRLAFDAARGRLWVVCGACGRWNLSPIEERWEAIEQCERRFRATRLHFSTDEIGLARLPEGLELVRIGAPQRPEFAAWRYGDQFQRRRMRALVVTGGIVTMAGVVVVTGSALLAQAVVPAGGVLWQVASWMRARRQRRKIVTTVPISAMDHAYLRMRHVPEAQILRHPDAGWALRAEHERGSTIVTGHVALRVAARVLAQLNDSGAFQPTVRAAVSRLEAAGGPAELLRATVGEERGSDVPRPRWLQLLPAVDRLALEMATHEESEQRALAGELVALEAEWRQAEQIASIADEMFLPDDVGERMRSMRLRET